MTFDKDVIKESLTIEDVFSLVAALGGNPRMSNDGTVFISQTICHHRPNEGSYKLYYYDNSKLFRCFTECNENFDIYGLIIKIQHCDLYSAVAFVANFFHLSNLTDDFDNTYNELQDWKILQQYEKNNNKIAQQIIQLQVYDEKILNNLPHPRILAWEQEGISPQVMNTHHIAYDPKNEGIVIPHYNEKNQLVGIRERTLISEEEENGKYKPAVLDGVMYNHPLSFNLYNLNHSANNIHNIGTAIVFEAEKSCLKYATYFGNEHDISVAVCGNSLSLYQVQLLLSLGAAEIIIAFDKQFQQLNDSEHKAWVKKLIQINDKYGNIAQFSFIFDKKGLLQYKDSPVDEGSKIFMQLYKERIFL